MSQIGNELLPCPFCGSEPECLSVPGGVWVRCPNCKASSDDSNALERWNRRASPIQADGLKLRTVGWAYRGPRGGLIVTEAKPSHAPEARAEAAEARIKALEELVIRAQMNVPALYQNWHADANKALSESKGEQK